MTPDWRSFRVALMPPRNGIRAAFNSWLRLTLLLLTTINYAGQHGYRGEVAG